MDQHKDSNLAGLWLRIEAAVIDRTILAIPCTVVFLDGYRSAIEQQKDLAFIPPWYMGLVGMLMLYVPLSAVYYIGMTAKFGLTIGKWVMGLRVVRTDGEEVTFTEAFDRWVSSALSTLLLGYGYLRVAWNADRQALHDVIAHTRVIKTSSPRGCAGTKRGQMPHR